MRPYPAMFLPSETGKIDDPVPPRTDPRWKHSGSLHILLCSTFGTKCRARHFFPYPRAKPSGRGGHTALSFGCRRDRQCAEPPPKCRHFPGTANSTSGGLTQLTAQTISGQFKAPQVVPGFCIWSASGPPGKAIQISLKDQEQDGGICTPPHIFTTNLAGQAPTLAA
jgi:hypothetical protein